ncbi:cryptochrome/photolyase family protein [Oryzibacter oryziterrae]|uniref:cryptochrome/photolyase family protein n=1 Tax=Oryzibacter oryziterrae TaxID=2766474 RepID=UPI001F35E006|nr:deoxyribodipyrimidine photo-lyase [Oryzibacter oryziterrae]
MQPTLVWFRNDLRVTDNSALSQAVSENRPVIALYVLERSPNRRPLGGATRWWLHHSLVALSQDLAPLGIPLMLREGDAEAVVTDVVRAENVGSVHWNRRYDGPGKATDAALKQALRMAGVSVSSHAGSLLAEPWTVKTKTGDGFRVFTPFWRALSARLPDAGTPLPRPKPVAATIVARLDEIEKLNLLPRAPDWSDGLAEAWKPGEAAARQRLDAFIGGALRQYAEERDFPAAARTSGLSPHLRFGEISPLQIYTAVTQAADSSEALRAGADKFLAELGWRDFCWHLLHFNPDLATRNFQPRFDGFPWGEADPVLLKAWQRGQTGYPIVDAGMRELWWTGSMHNRVRMIVASFLSKHLLIDWRQGESWFWDTLVDADEASNPASWQWVAGCGADAAPYFRIFNPILQSRKFDPDGRYIRHWVPELESLGNEEIHWPHEGRGRLVTSTTPYPAPLVDHDRARQRALAAFERIKSGAGDA